MIKIEIDAASGAEARAELLNLLGVNPLEINTKTFVPVKGTDETIPYETKPADEPTKTKRRTRAEIAADEAAKAETSTTDTSSTEDEAVPEGGDVQMEAAKYPELTDLQRACAVVVRAGYKQNGIDIIKNTGKADTSKDVAPELRQACIDELTKFAEDNKIAV